jgi:hypothetical protein
MENEANIYKCYQCKSIIDREEVIFTNHLQEKLPQDLQEEFGDFFSHCTGEEALFQYFDEDFYGSPNLCKKCFSTAMKEICLSHF